MMPRRTGLAVFIAVWAVSSLLVSCGTDTGSGGCLELGAGGGTIPVSIGCGDPVTMPVYQWDVEKPAFSVEVREVGKSGVVWGILSSSSENTINPPVQHGEHPFNTTEQGSDGPLEFDVKYRVTIVQIEGESGVQEFTLLAPPN